MPTEVFQHPTVTEVNFEIRYPILFSIENKIGDFQELLITQFPEAQQVFERVFGNIELDNKAGVSPDERQDIRKLWLFKSGTGYEVRISSNLLLITSTKHKTYNNPSSPDKFKDVIVFVMNNFFKLINIPMIKRVGLRYVDDCPLPSKTNETISKFYNLTFPIQRFPINDVKQFYFEVTSKKQNHNLIYREALTPEGKLVLDFDGFEFNVPSSDLITVTDSLHDIIEQEYYDKLREPTINYMRTGRLE